MRLAIFLALLTLAACAPADEIPQYDLQNAADAKADGGAVLRVRLTADAPSAQLHIVCSEFWSCDAAVQASITNLAGRSFDKDTTLLQVRADWVYYGPDGRGPGDYDGAGHYVAGWITELGGGGECKNTGDLPGRPCVGYDDPIISMHSGYAFEHFVVTVTALDFGADRRTPVDVDVSASWY